MSTDQIVVLLVFIGFCVCGAYLIKQANIELNKQAEAEKKDNK